MLRAPPMDAANRREVDRYMRRHKIREVVEKMLTDVIYGFPEEPLKRMGAFLESVQSGEILVESNEIPRTGRSEDRPKQKEPDGAAGGSKGSAKAPHDTLDDAAIAQIASFDKDSSGSIPASCLIEALAAAGIFITESDACSILGRSSLEDIGTIQLEEVHRIARACIQGHAKPDLKWMLATIDFQQLIAAKLAETLNITALSQLGSCTKEALQRALSGADELIAEEVLKCSSQRPMDSKSHCTEMESGATSEAEAAALVANAKFAATDGAKEAAYGSMTDFMKGLDAYLGLPSPKVSQAMLLEHLHSDDSYDDFVTSNYGGTVTCAATEWEFVVEPDLAKVYPGMQGSHGRQPKAVEFFLTHESAVAAGLSSPELIALRLYTGPMYMKYNAVLRGYPTRMVTSLKGNRYVTTIHALVSGIIKLSQVWVLPPDRKVYRGLGGLLLPKQFWEADVFGCKGGVEFGVMSTTTSRMVAAQYSGQWSDGARQTVLEIEVGQVDRGASLKFLSQYPAEEEIVIPPLSNLELVGHPRVEMTPKGEMLVVQMRVNVNLKSKTMEELVANRKQLQVSMVHQLLLETKRELGAETSALATFSDVLQSERAKAPEWFNDDTNLIASMSSALDTKRAILERHRVLMEAENKLRGHRLDERRTQLQTMKQRLEEEEEALMGYVEGDTGKFFKDTVQAYYIQENQTDGASGQAFQFVARWLKEAMSRVRDDMDTRPTDPHPRNEQALLARLVAQEPSIPTVTKFMTCNSELIRAMQDHSFQNDIKTVVQLCPHIAAYVFPMFLSDPQVLEPGGWHAATEKVQKTLEGVLSGEIVPEENERVEATYSGYGEAVEEENVEPTDYSSERDAYLRKALEEVPYVAKGMWRFLFPLHLYITLIKECSAAAKDAAQSGAPLDTRALASAFDACADKAWAKFMRHKGILGELAGVEQELREAPLWTDLELEQRHALQGLESQVAELKAKIDAEVPGLIAWDEQQLAALPPTDKMEADRPWLIPQHGGKNRRFLEWAAQESKEIADALEERRSVYLKHVPGFEDRHRRELIVLGRSFEAIARTCIPELKVLLDANPSSRQVESETEVQQATMNVRKLWDEHKSNVKCARHPDSMLVRFNERVGHSQDNIVTFDLCEVCSRLIHEDAPRFQCLTGLSRRELTMAPEERKVFWRLACKRMVCEQCHFLRSRCQVAFPVDAASAQSEDRTAHDRALKQLVRVASLTRKTFRGTEDARFEVDNDWSSAQLHLLSEKIVAATQPSESPEPTAVQQKLKDVVEFGEHNCLQHARLKVVSLLQPQGTVPATTETDPEQARARILQVLAPSAEDIKGASSKVQQLVAMKDYIRIVSLNEHRDTLLRKGVDAVVMDRLRDIPLMRFCRKDVVRRLEGVVDLVARLGRELPWLDEGDMPMDAETFKEWMEGMQEVVGRLGADERATALKEASYSCMTSLGNAGWMFQDADEALRCGWSWHMDDLPQDMKQKLDLLGANSTRSDLEQGKQLYGDAWRQKILMPSKNQARLQKEITWVLSEMKGDPRLPRRSMRRVLEIAELGLQDANSIDLDDPQLWKGCLPRGGGDDGTDMSMLEEAFWLGGLCPFVKQVGDINVELIAGRSAEDSRVLLGSLPPLELNFLCGLLHWTRSDVAVLIPNPDKDFRGHSPERDRPKMVHLTEMVAPGGRLDGRFQRCLQRQSLFEVLIRDDGGYSSYGHFRGWSSHNQEDDLDMRLLALMLRLPPGAGLRERLYRAEEYSLLHRMFPNPRTAAAPFGRRLDRLHIGSEGPLQGSSLLDVLRSASFALAELTLELWTPEAGTEATLNEALRRGLSLLTDVRVLKFTSGLSDDAAKAVGAALTSWGPIVGSRRMEPREGSDQRGFWLSIGMFAQVSKEGGSALVDGMRALSTGLGDGREPAKYWFPAVWPDMSDSSGIDSAVQTVLKPMKSHRMGWQKGEDERAFLILEMRDFEQEVHDEFEARLEQRVEYRSNKARPAVLDVAPIAPPPRPAVPSAFGVGLVLRAGDGGKFLVKGCKPGQAAAGVADIEPGDELTHIDDVQVSDASMVIMQDAIQGPQGTEVKLSFKKENGQVYHASLARGPAPSTGSGSGGDPEQGGPPLGSDVLSTDEPPASAGALASSDNPPPQKKTPKRRVVQGGGDSAFRVPTHQEREYI